MVMEPGSVRPFNEDEALIATFALWAEKDNSDDILIHMTGDNVHFKHITICNNPDSKKYHKLLYRDLKNLLKAHNKWPFGDE